MVPFGARSSSRPGRGSHRRPGQKKAREQPQSPLLPTVTVYLKKRLIPQSQYHKNTEQLDHCASNFSFQKNPDTEPTLIQWDLFFLQNTDYTSYRGRRLRCSTAASSLTHYSKSQIFVQKFNFDKTPNIFTSFSPKTIRQFF